MADDFIICVDTREQLPYYWPEHQTIRKTLKSGDYSLAGYEDRFAIERKQVAELPGLITKAGRDRFERELTRLARLDYAAIVVEGTLADTLRPHKYSRVNPKSIVGSLASWSVRFGVNVWFAENREYAQALTYKLLEKFWMWRRIFDFGSSGLRVECCKCKQWVADKQVGGRARKHKWICRDCAEQQD